jgi:hypothetical protein
MIIKFALGFLVFKFDLILPVPTFKEASAHRAKRIAQSDNTRGQSDQANCKGIAHGAKRAQY